MAFTFFFRDSQSLEIAVDRIVPDLIGHSRIYIWDAGCAHGPETYTLAIMLRERMSEMMFRNVIIYASDIDEGFEDQVNNGIYPEQEIKRISDDLRHKYFRINDSQTSYSVIDELRSSIRFFKHDLLSLKPLRNDFSLIVCKNVLLHFSDGQRNDVIDMFHRSLSPKGALVMENTQKMPYKFHNMFHPLVSYSQIYKKTVPENAIV
jgi:chemotaxis protein methyltransferase CheR